MSSPQREPAEGGGWKGWRNEQGDFQDQPQARRAKVGNGDQCEPDDADDPDDHDSVDDDEEMMRNEQGDF